MSLIYQTTVVTTTPHVVSLSDEVIFVNVPTAANLILPAITTVSGGRAYYIKDYSGNSSIHPITITTTGGDTIDGESFAMLNVNHSHIQVVYDGTNWQIIS